MRNKNPTIRMRFNKNNDSICDVCGDPRNKTVEMIDIQFGNKTIVTICDLCSNILFNKILKINCQVTAKVKSNRDMEIIALRKRKSRNKFK